MVKRIFATLDDKDFDKVNKYKSKKGWTWEQLVMSVVEENH